MNREDPLDSDSEAHLAHGERAAEPTAVAGDHDSLEDLDTFASTLDHAHVHADRIAGAERGDVVA